MLFAFMLNKWENVTKYDIYIYINFIFHNIVFQQNCTHNAYLFWFFFLHTVHFDETQYHSWAFFECWKCSITFHRFSLWFMLLRPSSGRLRPAPVSELCQWSLVGNNIGQACTFTQPPRQKTFIKTQDVEPAKRLKCVFVKIQMSGSIWCLFKPEKLIKHYSMNRNSCVTFAQPRILLLPQWIQAAGEQILPAPNELQPIKWPLSVNISQVKRICAFQTF